MVVVDSSAADDHTCSQFVCQGFVVGVLPEVDKLDHEGKRDIGVLVGDCRVRHVCSALERIDLAWLDGNGHWRATHCQRDGRVLSSVGI